MGTGLFSKTAEASVYYSETETDCQRATLKMEDGPSERKTARLENSTGSCCSSAGQRSDLFPWRNSEKGSDYLTQVSDYVSMHRHKTLDLENPPGATLTIGDLDDTIYSEEEDEVNGWGKFYLPEIVSMQVVGVVEGTSCPSDQLVLMTCEDRKVYAYDGEKLHLVASSMRQLQRNGIEYPAPKRYYEGEAFKHKTEEDWAEVQKRLDQQFHELVMSKKSELVMSKKSELLENLKLLKQNIESRGICMSLDCGRKPKNHHTEHANSTQNGPKPGSNPEPSCNVEISPNKTAPKEGHQNSLATIPPRVFRKEWPQKRQQKSWAEKRKRGKRVSFCIPAVTTKQLRCHRNSNRSRRPRPVKHWVKQWG
ncbi:uncharacterized protein LOC119503969 isoform X2 [Sebastes umbrosus]|uniref:uncharacterized protein LOC119503969 isoform X2 n=1 Tax=Sebastes umbrosus TaxID=72105 RepID=UPI00189E39A1|nr:uncharacterized protein LOC119503969 isoform X2 [Sebastes umbrosus]